MTEVPPEPTNREELLEQVFLEFAGNVPLSAPAQAYANDGNGLRNVLAELAHLREPNDLDASISSTRDAYMNVVLTRPTIINRLARKEKLRASEKDYEAAVINKLTAYTATDGTPESALALGQLPGIIRKASFNQEPLALRDFAANHLHLVMDTLLQEHAARRQIIDDRHNREPLIRLRDNRKLHVGVAAVIFAAAFVPEVLPGPLPEEALIADITLGLKIATALVFSVDGPEVVRLWYLDHAHNKRTAELNKQLASSQEATDLALRVVYGSPHYGSSSGFLAHSARSGTDNPEENATMLAMTDKQIDNMHGDPGGRPYTGQQALGYAARFLQERHRQLDAITSESDSEKREELFKDLVQEVLQEDLNRMKKGLTITRLRKTIMRGVAVAVSPFITHDLNAVSDAVAESHDIASYTISGPVKKSSQLEP